MHIAGFIVYSLTMRYEMNLFVAFIDFIRRCAQGERAAYDEFVSQYYSLLFGVVMKRVKDSDIAEDIVQEALLKIIKNNIFARFKGSTEAEFQHYLVRVALSSLNDFFRRRKKEAETDSIDFIDYEYEKLNGGQDILAEALNSELKSLLEQKIEELPFDYKTILKLKMMDYSHQEIADILQKPKGTIDGWMSRAFNQLRQHEELKDFLGGPDG